MNHSHQGNSAYFDSFALVKEPAASYNYDNDGHLISITETAKQSKAMEYDDDGHLTKYTDPKDYVTTYAYNAHGKLEKTTDSIDWGAVAIDGVWGAVGGALSFGVADVGGPACLTTRQIVSQPVNRVVSQAFGDLSTNSAIGTGTSLNSMAVNRMIKGEPDRQTRTASKPTRKTNNSRRRSFRGYTI